MEKLQKFTQYIKDKADRLLELEFLDETEYNELIDKKNEIHKELLCFDKDFNLSYPDAISHIQAYLFDKDIMYPKYILEDFMALVQTNDLIILAGQSGSGKTNLVKSFAAAIGGACKIIPVKPNWTSAEDLLGYYNPLEKKYLSTPFLDALLEASKNPNELHFICLDEMNLARVEYYLADFLSLLEERELTPEIKLYSDDESSHVLSEFRNVLDLISSTKEKYKKGNVTDFIGLLRDAEINQELKRVFGFSDKDSLIKYHTDLRRMISGLLNTPSSISFPSNVRLVGTVNIDETTHYLSPKILDRAHIMKFDSPLLFDWGAIESEMHSNHDVSMGVGFDIECFGSRSKYPKFDKDDEFCKILARLTKEYFSPLGIEIGLRTIRQGLNYKSKLSAFNDNFSLFLNNFILHKILPKMMFDGNKVVGDKELKDLLNILRSQVIPSIIEEPIKESEGLDITMEFDHLIEKAKSNDWIVNYWS